MFSWIKKWWKKEEKEPPRVDDVIPPPPTLPISEFPGDRKKPSLRAAEDLLQTQAEQVRKSASDTREAVSRCVEDLPKEAQIVKAKPNGHLFGVPRD